MSKADRLRRSREQTRQLLERVGYYGMVRRHGHTRPDFTPPPVRPHDPPRLGDGFGPTPPKRPPLPEDAKQFPIGNSHKQGLELITPGSNPADYNGAKK